MPALFLKSILHNAPHLIHCDPTGRTSWNPVATNTSSALSGLSNSQIYYWQVRAVNAGGNTLANSRTYWSFTTQAGGSTWKIYLPIVLR